jgi:hypothetical protein
MNEITTIGTFLREADSFIFVAIVLIAFWRKWVRWGFDYMEMKEERDFYRDKVMEQAEENARTIQAMADTLRQR